MTGGGGIDSGARLPTARCAWASMVTSSLAWH
jgi:hypothetical protein